MSLLKYAVRAGSRTRGADALVAPRKLPRAYRSRSTDSLQARYLRRSSERRLGAEELARAPMPDGRRLMHGLMKVGEFSPAEPEAAPKAAFAG